jgi:hypothetical protein
MGAEYVFVHTSRALLVAGPAAQIATRNHQVVVIAMLLGGITAQISGLTVNDDEAGALLVSLLILPLPVLATLAAGLELGGYRAVALGSFAVFLGLGAWGRRFGPRGANTAVLLFIGDFIGFFLHGTFTLSDMGWIAAILGVADVAIIAVRFVLFFPNRGKVRRHTQRAYLARGHRVAELAADLLGTTPGHGQALRVRRLGRHLVRLNEAALIIDALLAAPGRDPDTPYAARAHQLLFDLELTLTNMGRFAIALAGADLPEPVGAEARRALAAVRDGDLTAARRSAGELLDASDDRSLEVTTGVLVRRLAGTISDYCRAAEGWAGIELTPPPVRAVAAGGGGDDASAGRGGDPAPEWPPFQPAVTLNAAGMLPGAADVSTRVATGGEGRFVLHLTPGTRAGIQTAVAVAASAWAGDALSPRRFYWAVLAAFISFLGVTHSLEQVRKAAYRVIGTVLGIVLGSVIVHVVGHRTPAAVAVILGFLFLGNYLFRVNYTFLAIAITVVVAQLYVALDEFSNALLLLRLEETALGAVIAMLTGILVVPIRTRRVVGAAVAEQLDAVATAVDAVKDVLEHPGWPGVEVHARLLDAARAVDSAYQAVLSASQPMRWSAFGEVHRRLATAVAAAGAARHYTRNLALDVPGARGQAAPSFLDPVRHLRDSIAMVAGAAGMRGDGRQPAGGGAGDQPYVRSASLFAEAESRRGHGGREGGTGWLLVARDFQLLDGAVARLAQTFGIPVVSLDRAAEPPVGAAADRPHGRRPT